MASYRYLVADLITGVIREELPFSEVSYGARLNAPGSFSGKLGLYHKKATKQNLAINQTSIYVERDGVIVWAGMVNATPVEPGALVTVTGIGYGDYFDRRTIRVNKSYPATDKLFIARDLINYAQSVANGSIGVVVGTETSGILTNLVIGSYERKRIGEIFGQLSRNTFAIGFDYSYDAAWEGPVNAQVVVKRLHLFYPRRGALVGSTLTYGKDFQKYTYNRDGTNQETAVDGIGPGEGPSALILGASDPTFAPVFDGVASYKDVTDWSILWWLTQVRLAANKMPRETITITMRPGAVEVGAFAEGDYVEVVLEDGALVDVNDVYRIDSYSVSVSDEGEEQITFTLLSPIMYYGS